MGDQIVPGESDYVGALTAMQPRETGASERFAEFRKLARFRFTQAIFGVGNDTGSSSRPTSNPVTRRTWLVDPVRDAQPGTFNAQSPESGWSTVIGEAFSGPVATGSPLETLLKSVHNNDPVRSVVQDFDLRLDDAYVTALSDPRMKDSQRAETIAWYGRYLTRLFAVSNGISAFRREAAAWTLAWSMAPVPPTELDLELRTLIRPPRGADFSDPAIPVLASRVEPIVGLWSEPKLALTSGTFKLVTRTVGESLEFRVQESDSSSPWIPLDFALVRQAQACTAGAIGVTEVADDTSPRLERFRSTQLLPGVRDSGDYVVLSGSKTMKIQIGSLS